MTDPLARITARNAHERLNELTKDLRILERRIPNRPAMFVARCALCGHACNPRRRYCHAHTWAEGT